MSDDFLPGSDRPEEPAEEVRAPFSFKLMIALTVAYLGWRLVQGIVWVVEKLS
ncbi:MAG TPA: hypothetical protein VNT92_08810 [Acidimicrobiia bacterium]|nr:hypothetical protein [Acidimicrobiia bacterium]